MPCSICRQSGHNRATCPQRNITGIPNRAGGNQSSTNISQVSVLRRTLIKKKWKTAIRNIIYIHRFIDLVEREIADLFRAPAESYDIKLYYPSWSKIRRLNDNVILWHARFSNQSLLNPSIRQKLEECRILHRSINPDPPPPRDDRKKVALMNMRDDNYLIYWVVGNYMIQDLDSQENQINYLGFLPKKGTFKLKTMDGHRFYIVPHRLNSEPPYHPKTDKEFFIEPYCQINIHEETSEKIFVDEGQTLSEMNKWKFNALKLDYLIKEVIKLGGKNNDVLECVLDLHQDIKLDSFTEMDKEMAGIPSIYTNIT
jgi:hypothetical protein